MLDLLQCKILKFKIFFINYFLEENHFWISFVKKLLEMYTLAISVSKVAEGNPNLFPSYFLIQNFSITQNYFEVAAGFDPT